MRKVHIGGGDLLANMKYVSTTSIIHGLTSKTTFGGHLNLVPSVYLHGVATLISLSSLQGNFFRLFIQKIYAGFFFYFNLIFLGVSVKSILMGNLENRVKLISLLPHRMNKMSFLMASLKYPTH